MTMKNFSFLGIIGGVGKLLSFSMLLMVLSGCWVATGPDPRAMPVSAGPPVMQLGEVTEKFTGTWTTEGPKSDFVKSKVIKSIRNSKMVSNDASNLILKINITSDHVSDGPRLFELGFVSCITLGLFPLDYHSEWTVHCDVQVTMADGRIVARYPIQEVGTFDITVWPPTWLFLNLNWPFGGMYGRQMNEKTANNVSVQIIETINSDYQRLAQARDLNAIALGSMVSGQQNVPFRPPPEPSSSGPSPISKRWAVIIGVSDYKFRGKWGLDNLRYAARDAQVLADYLKSDKGGRFDNVTLLLDKDATTQNVKIALRENLRAVQKGDFVLISWSGHGGPDPSSNKDLYLITYDSDPEHMAATSYSMSEMQEDVGKLQADRILLLADTCHSAGISDPKIGFKGARENKIVEGIKGVQMNPKQQEGKDTSMRMIFTSCESGETSLESSDLGGGHGAFSWFLLKAMMGDADKKENGGNGNGIVTLGEVIEYTRDQVKRYSKNQQHPDTAGRFDRNIVIGPSQ